MNNFEYFKNNRYGMMVHFGLYSLLGGEYKGIRTPSLSEWIQSYCRIPKKDYEKLAAAFNPIYFNAEEWVLTAKKAGMKYIVVTSKHHEGFALFHSKVDKFNVVDATPFKRDIIKELADACKKHDMKLGLYYSQCLDWREENGGGYYDHGIKNECNQPWCNDWDFPWNDKKNYAIAFEKKIKPQVKELLTNYGDLFLIWFDVPFNIEPEQTLELYNMVKKYQPDCLINSRLCVTDTKPENGGIGFFEGMKFDYTSLGDNEIPKDGFKENELVECPATMNNSWGFKYFDNNWKTPEQVYGLKKYLNDHNINYLLNVGPDGLGRIPAVCVDILNKVAELEKEDRSK